MEFLTSLTTALIYQMANKEMQRMTRRVRTHNMFDEFNILMAKRGAKKLLESVQCC